MFNKEIENKIIDIINGLKKDYELEFKFFSDRNNELEYSSYIKIIDYTISRFIIFNLRCIGYFIKITYLS